MRSQISGVCQSVFTTPPGVPLRPKPAFPAGQRRLSNAGCSQPVGGASVVNCQALSLGRCQVAVAGSGRSSAVISERVRPRSLWHEMQCRSRIGCTSLAKLNPRATRRSVPPDARAAMPAGWAPLVDRPAVPAAGVPAPGPLRAPVPSARAAVPAGWPECNPASPIRNPPAVPADRSICNLTSLICNPSGCAPTRSAMVVRPRASADWLFDSWQPTQDAVSPGCRVDQLRMV